jgi:hypothetical protein
MWGGSLSGPVALPGIYKVTLEVDDVSHSQTFEIKQDPRSESTPEDLIAQFNFIREVNAKVSEAHVAIKQIREVRNQIEQIRPALKAIDAGEPLLKLADEIEKSMKEVEERLYQTKNRSNQDPLNFPIKLNNKLAYLNTITRKGDYRPTTQSYAVKEEMSQAIDAEIGTLRKIMEEDLPEFNKRYRELELDPIKPNDQVKSEGPQ